MFKKILTGALVIVLIAGVVGVVMSATNSEDNGTEPTIENPIVENPIKPAEPEKPTIQENTKKAITVLELVEKALNGEYEDGDVVLVYGTAIEVYVNTDEEIAATPTPLFNTIFLGPRVLPEKSAGYVARFESERLQDMDRREAGYKSFMSFRKVKVGDRITIKGTYHNPGGISYLQVMVVEATVQ